MTARRPLILTALSVMLLAAGAACDGGPTSANLIGDDGGGMEPPEAPTDTSGFEVT
jgi:hypothetical protein